MTKAFENKMFNFYSMQNIGKFMTSLMTYVMFLWLPQNLVKKTQRRLAIYLDILLKKKREIRKTRDQLETLVRKLQLTNS